jgi:hypothetical protein
MVKKLKIRDNLYLKETHAVIAEGLVEDGRARYTIQLGQGVLSFSGQPKLLLPVGTRVRVVLLDRDKDPEDIREVHTLVGVALDRDSSYFALYRRDDVPHFASGVIYDATQEGRDAFFLEHPAPLPVTCVAYNTLYWDLRDMRPYPDRLSRDDASTLTWRRVTELVDLKRKNVLTEQRRCLTDCIEDRAKVYIPPSAL